MANRYWVGGTNTWNSTAGTKWALTSGGAGGQAAPTYADDVYLDASSGAVTVTMSSQSAARSIDCLGFTGTLSHPAGVNMLVGDATAGQGNHCIRMVSGMTYTVGNTFTSIFTFVSTSATEQTITSGGKQIRGNFNGVGGYWKLADNLTVTSAGHTLTNGTFDTNGYTYSSGIISTNVSNTRVLKFGSSSITLTSTSLPFDAGAGTNLTVDAGTSTITCNGAGAKTFAGGGKTYYNVDVGNPNGGVSSITGANTFNNLTSSGSAAQNNALRLYADQTVNGTLTFTGNSTINRYLLRSDIFGASRTVTVNGTVTMSNVDISDMTGAGSASWNISAITGGSGDCGGNSGITFTTAATQTWQGTTGGNWTTLAKWTSRVPLAQDDVVVNNAFSASQTITYDGPTRSGKDINFTGVTGSPALTVSVGWNFFGSLTLAAGLGAVTLTGGILAAGRSTHTITTAGKSLGGTNVFQIFTPTGVFTLQDDLTITGNQFQVLGGTFDANDNDLTAPSFTILGIQGLIATTYMGNGIWTTTSTAAGAVWTGGAGANSLSAEGSTIVISGASANSRTFAGAGATYNNLTYTVAGSTGALVITGANTFATLNFSDASNARTLTLPASTTTTVTTTFNVIGTSGKLMTIDSSTSGTAATLSKSSGDVVINFVSLKDSTATGGAVWWAGKNSTNVSGNTGWNFSTPVFSSANASAIYALIAAGATELTSSGTTSAVSSVTGDGDVALAGTGNAGAIFGLTGAAKVSASATANTSATFSLAGNGDTAVVGTATTTATFALAGAAAVSVSASGNSASVFALAGTGSVALVGSGLVSPAFSLSGNADLALSAAGTTSGTFALAGDANLAAVGSSSTSFAFSLSASGNVVSAASGATGSTFSLAGAANVSYVAAGSTSGNFEIAGAGVAYSVASGSSSSTFALTGNADLALAASGLAGSVFSLSAFANITSNASGNAAGEFSLSGVAKVGSAASGAAGSTFSLSGAAKVSYVAAGSTSGDFELTGAGVAYPAGSGAISATFALSGDGDVSAVATGAAGAAFGLSASGSVALVGSGVVSATFGLAGAAANSIGGIGATGATFSLAGSSGSLIVANALADATFSLTATGSRTAESSGTVTLVFGCAAAGYLAFDAAGNAGGIFGLTGSATAVGQAVAAGSFSITFGLSGVGRVLPPALRYVIVKQRPDHNNVIRLEQLGEPLTVDRIITVTERPDHDATIQVAQANDPDDPDRRVIISPAHDDPRNIRVTVPT